MSEPPADVAADLDTAADKGTSAPAAHWRRRAKGPPMPSGHAARQGDIAGLAFQALGRDSAIAFLNTPNERLGGRPIALATESTAGEAEVRTELLRLIEDRTQD